LDAAHGVRVRLTGDVPLSDQEFATVAQGAGLNSSIMVLIVAFLLWAALRSAKIVFAILICVAIGLSITAALGLAMVGALNLISVAFAVLFVGIGADFGIQFSVRYRAERHAVGDLSKAISLAGVRAGRPLALAAAATACGFFAFLPTVYKGVSELGLIAGTGMIVAFFTSVTVLPALLTLFRPPPETKPIGYAFLAPADAFMARHRYAIIIGTLVAVFAASPLLFHLRFDFNPLNLNSDKVESVSTLKDLMKDPATTYNTIDVVARDPSAASALAAKLEKVPEVQRVTTLQSFVPTDQTAKLAIIQQAVHTLGPLLARPPVPPPGDAELAASLSTTAAALKAAAAAKSPGPTGAPARHFVDLLQKMAVASPDKRAAATAILIPPLKVALTSLRDSLKASPVTLASIPAELKRQWQAPNGATRVEAAPKGDPNNNATIRRFTRAVTAVAPDAAGAPIAIQGAGDTVVKAFIEAGFWALLSISILLYIVLRRVTDVLLTLVPLLIAGAVTLEICVAIGLRLNFANIIALPLLLGLGVAFKIYFVMAWRAGVTNLLQSSLTRAVFFSALVTATAFGSLWLSHHPGTSSMGKLLALSLVCTLAAAVLFQPALMGPPRAKEGEEVL
ncbi:MAG TPA: MMPL family transporter, partial [Beijerinckiaceae bacterium]|nr:MMPL family transporter [Beijerinckiaceae bacterium]